MNVQINKDQTKLIFYEFFFCLSNDRYYRNTLQSSKKKCSMVEVHVSSRVRRQIDRPQIHLLFLIIPSFSALNGVPPFASIFILAEGRTSRTKRRRSRPTRTIMKDLEEGSKTKEKIYRQKEELVCSIFGTSLKH